MFGKSANNAGALNLLWQWHVNAMTLLDFHYKLQMKIQVHEAE